MLYVKLINTVFILSFIKKKYFNIKATVANNNLKKHWNSEFTLHRINIDSYQ